MTAGASPAAGLASPCNRVCRIDPVSGWCEGCRRSLDEIAGWSAMDDAGKAAVLAQLAARRLAPSQSSRPGADGSPGADG